MSAVVLLVDDNDDNLRIMREILVSRGYDVRIAHDGPSALRLLELQRPNVVLLDVMMPEMGGMEVLDRIKASPGMADIPVILVTAKAHDEDLLTGYKYGADYYITKPFTAKQLLYGIGLVLGSESA